MNRERPSRKDGFTRRDFLRMGSCLAAGFGLLGSHAEALAKGLEKVYHGEEKVLWLQGMSCSGCSVSFLNAVDPDPLEILTRYVSLVFHQTLSAAQGSLVGEILGTMAERGGYVLVFEGAVPLGMPEACKIDGRPLDEILPPLLEKAKAVVAAGTCAAFGGIPAAEGNPTGAVGLKGFMDRKGLRTEGRLVNCPSCPVHPKSLVGTLAHVSSLGYPEVDPELLTPAMFYKHSTHDQCPRFHYWERRIFARQLGDPEGCLFKLGCLGALSHTDCPKRQWNGGVNWCVRAGAPCIACSSEIFARKRDFPFYRKGEQYHEVRYGEERRRSALGAAAVAEKAGA